MLIEIRSDLTDPYQCGQLVQAVDNINTIQAVFRFVRADKSDGTLPGTGALDANDALTHLNAIADRRQQPFIFVTGRPFLDGKVGRKHRHSKILTIAGWEDFAPPSLSAYVAFMVAHAALTFPAGLREEQVQAKQHKEVVGCLQDLWETRVKIKVSMVAGIICGPCKEEFRRYGVKDKYLTAVERILSIVRQEAIGRPVTIDHSTAFVIMKYDKENSQAFERAIKPGLQAAGLTAERADRLHATTDSLLEHVIDRIRTSSYVVAKVDSKSLNVYFEIGLAKALDEQKELLLIAHKGFRRPTDLAGMIVLQYAPRNYAELKRKITNHFVTKYGLTQTL